jgi:hypothetical protein
MELAYACTVTSTPLPTVVFTLGAACDALLTVVCAALLSTGVVVLTP